MIDLSTVPTELYHLERVRHILDTPRGYGIRLEYLRISMSLEEQFAFLDRQRRLLAMQLDEVRKAPNALSPDQLDRTVSRLERTISKLSSHLPESSIATPTNALSERIAGTIQSLGDLDVGDLRLLHRELTDEQPWANGGQFRLVNAWIGDEDHTSYVPPPPEAVPTEIETVLARWRRAYPRLAASPEPEVVQELARLHYGICAVHPFVDANGRLARTVLDLAAEALLSRRVSSALTRNHEAYYESLGQANRGDFEPLEKIIASALFDT